MSEWKEVKLGGIANVQTGPFGSQLHNEDYKVTGIPIVTVEHLGNKRFTKQNLPFVSDEDCIRLGKYSMHTGDIIFSRVGAVDRCSYVTSEENGWLFSGRCLRVRCNEDINSEWLYYFFCLDSTKQNIRSIAVGATMPSINTNILSNDVIVRIPCIESQRRIAAILSSLDAKIENNNKVNAKLEEIAQNLFKEWFVDFGPFKDGKFVDSELGPIPEGWRVGTLSDIGSIVGGSTPSKSHPEYYTSEGIAWLTPKDLSNTGVKFTSKGEIDITEAGYNSTSTKLMPKGSVLFSSRAPIGYLTIAKNEICTNQGFKSVVPTFAGTGFIYYLLKQLTPEIENRAVGTTFKEASGSLMSSLNVIIPDKKVLDRFEILIKSLFDKQELLETESFKLSTLRDTLLPKLMSGEIEV